LARVAGAALMLAAAGSWLAGLALHSRLLRIDRIAVSGQARLTVAEVEALVADVRGRSIFDVDLDVCRRQLMASAWVSDAALARVLPSTIEIRIVERVPMVVARVAERLYLVDETGVVIDEFAARYRDFDLPIVDGLVSPPIAPGSTADAQRLLLTRRFLDALGVRPDFRRRVSQLDVSGAYDVAVLLDGDSALLHLGDRRFAERLATYVDLAPALRERVGELDYVDLRFDERLYVRRR
jgi:cell division septal protein FtsQ